MQRKFIDESFVIYDKKRKGFMINFQIDYDFLNSISKNCKNAKMQKCKNAKKFDTKKEAQHCIDTFFETARKIYNNIDANNKFGNRDDWRFNRIPNYTKDDFEIFIIKTQIKLSRAE